ncbi:hypothetical protein [Albibacillus kandeliae]|uniref:hypothetical protein n=1 Tax=Albibacillus kandeliae TaxID=2174228 RepID=UPI000D69B171|nr:hypothetical protein [Albibacillus kandeliae]
MRLFFSLVAVGALAACAPQVPESGPGYFDSQSDRAAREQALAGGGFAPPMAVDGQPLSATGTAGLGSSADSGDIAAETAAALAASSPAGSQPVAEPAARPLPEAVAQPQVQAGAVDVTGQSAVPDNPGISAENDFAAVSAERTIQDDAQRIAQMKQEYEVIQPTALPSRTGSADPNIVTFALQTSHPRGTRMYDRSGVGLPGRTQRACAKYDSPDQAQMDFLSKGGPERDRLGLDPDGDGYACAWNPAPFRAAKNN